MTKRLTFFRAFNTMKYKRTSLKFFKITPQNSILWNTVKKFPQDVQKKDKGVNVQNNSRYQRTMKSKFYLHIIIFHMR